MSDGIILIDKPAGLTSFGVVARLRRVLTAQAKGNAMPAQPSPKRVKVGHTGTLDPFATGLMILVVGPACKRAQQYSKLDKVYQATIRLGATSTTGDPEGELTSTHTGPAPSQANVEAALAKFRGEIRQRPPAFSAIKVDGKRAYQLARNGQAVELPARAVTIYSLELVRYQYPELVVRAHVSSGTYIRSLAVDIGQALGTGAYCSQLRRLSVGQWQLTDAKQLTDFGITT